MTRPRWQQVLIALGKALCYLFLFLGWQVLVSTIYSFGITFQLAGEDPAALLDQMRLYDAIMAKTMEISLMSALFTMVSLWGIFKLRRRSLVREVWLRPVPGRVLAWAAALAFCLYWLVNLVLSLLPEPWLESYGEASAGLQEISVIAVLATAVAAPIVEETVFRGLIYTRLQRAMPGWLAVVLSAALFGACHGEPMWIAYAFVLGFIFALLVWKTGSILPSLLMHVVFNTTNEVVTLLVGEDTPLWFLVLTWAAATAGTLFCALRLRRALAAAPPPPPPGPPQNPGPGWGQQFPTEYP